MELKGLERVASSFTLYNKNRYHVVLLYSHSDAHKHALRFKSQSWNLFRTGAASDMHAAPVADCTVPGRLP